METFEWSARLETGIEVVDQQHRQLVDIVNRLGGLQIDGHASQAAITGLFDELAGYAQQHFADEEELMAQAGIDARHAKAHQGHHLQFVDLLGQMWRGRAELKNPAEVLHGFLTSWLTFHILEEDRAMARQLASIGEGVAAAEAFQRDAPRLDDGSAVLLAAMSNLYRVLALQNQDLADANLRLEEKVAARTRQLVQAERMAALGLLAAGVAHDINGPVGAVRSNLGALRQYSAQLLQLVDAGEAFAAGSPGSAAALGGLRAEVGLDLLRQDLAALLQESQDGLDRVSHIVRSLTDQAHQAALVDADLQEGRPRR